MDVTQKYLNELSYKVIGCAIEVHKELGPGLIKSAYEKCFSRELFLKGINFRTQLWVPIEYKGLRLEEGQRTFVNEYYSALLKE
ncbi:MAG: GxxExxY protein [Ferruginibacter sp.]